MLLTVQFYPFLRKDDCPANHFTFPEINVTTKG